MFISWLLRTPEQPQPMGARHAEKLRGVTRRAFDPDRHERQRHHENVGPVAGGRKEKRRQTRGHEAGYAVDHRSFAQFVVPVGRAREIAPSEADLFDQQNDDETGQTDGKGRDLVIALPPRSRSRIARSGLRQTIRRQAGR
jgi:hypothetical protein